MPFLRAVQTIHERIIPLQYPFTIPAFSNGINIEFKSNVTFFIGENGSGKSTLLEGIADNCGFNLAGGGRNHLYQDSANESDLSTTLRLIWNKKVSHGFFMRAESFFNFATYIDDLAADDPSILEAYGGKSLHHQSHGESFLSLFSSHFNKGLYILDEPEAALSPNRQMSFLSLIHELESAGRAQFLIATHSPIILSYPSAVIFSLDETMDEVSYKDTDHYNVTKDFLDCPERYLRHLFSK